MKHELIGQPEFTLKARKEDYRIVKRDSQGYIVTCDFNTERLNIEIEKGIITEVTYG